MDFFDALVRYEIDLWNHVDRRLAAAGQVSLATLEALRVLARHDGSARVHELQAGLRITVGAASKLTDRLERDGLATRRPNPRDRRSSIVELTRVGRRHHDDGCTIMAQVLADHTRGEVAQLSVVTTALGRLTDRLAGELVR